MIVWGGSNSDDCQNSQYLNTGGRYCGQYPTPTPTPTPIPIITVTNTNDSGTGSLRQALADAIDGDTIEFAVTGTVELTSGELLVDKSIAISGPGPENLAVSGNAKSRVFHVTIPCGNVTISGLTITNGYATGSGGGIHNDHAALTLNNCTIIGNQGWAASTMMRKFRERNAGDRQLFSYGQFRWSLYRVVAFSHRCR